MTKILVLLMVSNAALVGCVGTVSVPNDLKAGDTVELAIGRNEAWTPANTKVTVFDSSGTQTVYPPGDPAIRALVNLYPDPLSELVVGTATNQNTGYNGGATSGAKINAGTGGDEDWWETVLFLDLPAVMDPGTAVCLVETLDGSESEVLSLNIVSGSGTPLTFGTKIGTLTSPELKSLQRSGHYEITLNGSPVPAAASVTLTHNPDASQGGVGVPYVVNPRGDIKNVAWSDDGNQMKVILTAAHSTSVDSLVDFKFYVTGGISGLIPVPGEVKAFDSNGNELPGFTASVVSRN